MKICIIGSSGHYGYVIDAAKKDNSLCIAGISPGPGNENIERLRSSAAVFDYSIPEFNNYKEMLDNVKPDIAVVNCFFGYHAEAAIEVLKREIHIFMEKPIAVTLDELDKLREVYEKSGVCLAAMFALRYNACFYTAREAVKRGRIGKIRLMDAKKSYKLGIRGENFKDRKLYGGTIPWVGSHAIDWLYWFSGEKFESVYATHSTRNNNDHDDLEVTALCHFTLANDIFGSVTIDYLRPKEAPSHADDGIRIVGTDGIIEVRDGSVCLINSEAEGVRRLDLLPEKSIFDDFIGEINNMGECMISAEDSFYVTEACLKARESADKHKIIMF